MLQNDYFFTAAEHEALRDIRSYPEALPSSVLTIADRFTGLQRSLSRRISATGSELQPCWSRGTPVNNYSFSANCNISGLSFAFLRPRAQAVTIEKMMGRGANGLHQAEPYRHPVIEVRVTPEHFAIEIIMSPYAWWDQRNFVGKLRIARHVEALRSLLGEGMDSLHIGFWSGAELCDSHLTCRQIMRGKFMEEWFGTFAAEHDWFRIGVWYPVEDRALTYENTLPELSRKVMLLAKLYKYLAWTSENNFHSFVNSGRHSLKNGHVAL